MVEWVNNGYKIDNNGKNGCRMSMGNNDSNFD